MSLGITTKKFSLEIEDLVKTKHVPYMDAVIMFCEAKDIEPERVARFIDKSMKEKIQNEAEELNYLKGNCSKAKKLLNWKPKYELKDILYEMIEYWMKKRTLRNHFHNNSLGKQN